MKKSHEDTLALVDKLGIKLTFEDRELHEKQLLKVNQHDFFPSIQHCLSPLHTPSKLKKLPPNKAMAYCHPLMILNEESWGEISHFECKATVFALVIS